MQVLKLYSPLVKGMSLINLVLINLVLINLTTSAGYSSARILLLPSEIHFLIFAHLDDVVDCAALGLTSKYFWRLALPVLHDKWASNLGSWAGEKIVCVGGYIQAGGCLDQSSSSYLQSLGSPARKPSSKDFIRLAFLGEYQHLRTIWGEAQKKSFLSACLNRLVGYRWMYKSLVKPDFNNFKEDCFYPRDQPWILRNLTTKEFVRSEAIALKPEFIHGPRIRGIGFEHALLTRIFWVPSDVVENIIPEEFVKGLWAGHQFDIVQLSRHVETTKGETWADISTEVMADISFVWRWMCGPHWKENAIRDAERLPPC
ncbi:hypothetical protein F4811DRAFT_194421 [Daldinia bambusicola]|nr:hypothetical protein F4811DRAFT_194421 [Daldinia bambusicola]